MDKVLRTPESRFVNLKDYPFNPHFVKVGNFQMHYLDEGSSCGDPVLLLHGVPAWSYLYRHLIREIAEGGSRIIAPDLIGFGKSDKPGTAKFHNYKSHVDWMSEFISRLNLKNILLFCHDGGSLIGLRIICMYPDLFTGIIVSNGMLPTGEHKIHPTFRLWKFFARYSPVIPVDLVIESGTLRKLDKEEKRAYRAPFPSSKYKIAIREFPSMVPITPNDPEAVFNKKVWKSLGEWNKPFMTVFGKNDPITRNGDKYLREKIPGAIGQDHKRLNAGHFIQEDKSRELAEIIIRFKKETEFALKR
jgi:haloalkane dehalogenase